MKRLARLAAIVVAAAAVSGSTCRRNEPVMQDQRIDALRAENDKLREQVNALMAKDPIVTRLSQIVEPVILAIRPKMVERVINEVTFHYLDEVLLDLEPNIHVNYTREITRKTLIGKVKAGTLTVNIDVRAIKGRMTSREPRVAFAGGNRVDLAIPVRVDRGEGLADFFFSWDSAGLANLLCKDFQFTDKLKGTIVTADYPLRAGYVLSATAKTIAATPVFPPQKFRLRLDLTPESWTRVQRAFEDQDSFGKCGVAIDPQKAMERLKEIGQRGFDVKLPKSLIRGIDLPASVEQQVNVDDNIVALTVKPGVLSLDKDTLIFSSAVTTSVAAMAIDPLQSKKKRITRQKELK